MNATLNFVRLRPQILLVGQKSLNFKEKRRSILDNTAVTKSCNDAYIGNFEIGYILNHVAANVMRQ